MSTQHTQIDWCIGGKYNWMNQPERLVYLGRNWSGNGFWHQFAQEHAPETIWCEVTDTDLVYFEETKPAKATGNAAHPEAKEGNHG